MNLCLMLSTAMLFGAAASPAAGVTQPFTRVQIPPADESAGDPSFAAFWAAFKEAVSKRDAKALLALADAEITAGWDGQVGPDALRGVWQLDARGAKSELWPRLDEVIRLGVASYPQPDQPAAFAAPALFAKLPEEFADYSHVLIAGEKVNVREAPSATAPVVSQESHTVVRDLPEPEPKRESIGGAEGEWLRVALPEGKTGYVFSRFLRSPLDYRAIFLKRESGWKWTAFVAGD